VHPDGNWLAGAAGTGTDSPPRLVAMVNTRGRDRAEGDADIFDPEVSAHTDALTAVNINSQLSVVEPFWFVGSSKDVSPMQS
jgi:hypothetical protein